jgi:hypothetical protein
LSNSQEQDAKLKFGEAIGHIRAIEFLYNRGLLEAVIAGISDENSKAEPDTLKKREGGKELATGLVEALGIFDTNEDLPNKNLIDMFAATMFSQLPQGDHRRIAENEFQSVYGPISASYVDDYTVDTTQLYTHAAIQSPSLKAQGYNLMGDHKRKQRIGKALMGTPAYEQMDVLIRH